jgi:hypothetical protein
LEDCGCLLGEEKDEYRAVMNEYSMAKEGYGPHSHEGNLNYIAYSILNSEGIREMEYVHYTSDADNKLYRDAAEMICFSDCSDEIVEAIVAQGWKIEYVGWQPDMLFEFRDQKTGEIVWSENFPQWEH